MLCTDFNTVGFNWIASLAAMELKSVFMDWLGKMLKLPNLEFGLIPLYLCCTARTISSIAVNPLGPLFDVAKECRIWIHVDAAYAGSACICPEFRHFLDGVEGANSFNFNAHKWLLNTLDSCYLRGGIATLIDMPLNSFPSTVSEETFKLK
ncbi:hypothetical protein RJ639_010544, partial [Escallonia herrerae]